MVSYHPNSFNHATFYDNYSLQVRHSFFYPNLKLFTNYVSSLQRKRVRQPAQFRIVFDKLLFSLSLCFIAKGWHDTCYRIYRNALTTPTAAVVPPDMKPQATRLGELTHIESLPSDCHATCTLISCVTGTTAAVPLLILEVPAVFRSLYCQVLEKVLE
jgi:hypothetical protein